MPFRNPHVDREQEAEWLHVMDVGARWLDKQKPNWEDTIDFDEFDIGDGRKCVLGQAMPWRSIHTDNGDNGYSVAMGHLIQQWERGEITDDERRDIDHAFDGTIPGDYWLVFIEERLFAKRGVLTRHHQ